MRILRYIIVLLVLLLANIYFIIDVHNWLNKNSINNPKCPNCNFDLMSVDINQLRQKMHNNSIKKENSTNENLISNSNLKNSSNNSNNNSINLNRNKKNYKIKNNNSNNPTPITITHISINYNLSSNKKTKDNESGNDSDSEENEHDDSNGNEIKIGNIYSSQNRLNDENEEEEEDKKGKNLFKNKKIKIK